MKLCRTVAQLGVPVVDLPLEVDERDAIFPPLMWYHGQVPRINPSNQNRMTVLGRGFMVSPQKAFTYCIFLL